MCDVQKPVSDIQGGGNAIVAIVDPWLFLPMHILNLYICMHLYAAICSDMQRYAGVWLAVGCKQTTTHPHTRIKTIPNNGQNQNKQIQNQTKAKIAKINNKTRPWPPPPSPPPSPLPPSATPRRDMFVLVMVRGHPRWTAYEQPVAASNRTGASTTAISFPPGSRRRFRSENSHPHSCLARGGQAAGQGASPVLS